MNEVFEIKVFAIEKGKLCFGVAQKEWIKVKVKSKVHVFDTPQVSTVLRSNLMRLYFPVDLTGNLIMIEKLVSGGTWTRDLPIFSPTR